MSISKHQVLLRILVCLLIGSCAQAVAPATPLDATIATDSMLSCFLDNTYTYRSEGGFTGCSSGFTIDTQGRINRFRQCPITSTPTNECSAQIPGCDQSGEISLSALRTALADADVVASFTSASGPVVAYGIDPRGHDGLLVTITRGDGRGFSIGDGCNGRPNCIDAPSGIGRLIRVIFAIGAMYPSPDCMR